MAASATAPWVAAGAAVLLAIATGVLAYLAFRQMRASCRQSDALNRQATAMDELARTAAAQEFRTQIGNAMGVFSTPEQDMAKALRGIAITLAHAFPQPAVPTDEEPPEGETSGRDGLRLMSGRQLSPQECAAREAVAHQLGAKLIDSDGANGAHDFDVVLPDGRDRAGDQLGAR